jgi:hypothetical protein
LSQREVGKVVQGLVEVTLTYLETTISLLDLGDAMGDRNTYMSSRQ